MADDNIEADIVLDGVISTMASETGSEVLVRFSAGERTVAVAIPAADVQRLIGSLMTSFWIAEERRNRRHAADQPMPVAEG